MNLDDPKWMVEMKKSFDQGKLSNSIFDNPYWKSYPKEESTFEESLARWWVEGYVSKWSNNETV